MSRENNSSHTTENRFSLRLFKPQGKLSPYVQAIWSLSVSKNNTENVKRWLQVDACSGILFNLTEAVYLDDDFYAGKVIFLPVEKQAHSMTWPPGTELVGLRFHPGVSFGVFNQLFDKPFTLDENFQAHSLKKLGNSLGRVPFHFARLNHLYRWLNSEIPFSEKISPTWQPTLKLMRKPFLTEEHQQEISISQRQLERHFKKLIGITPKHYQRIQRIRNTLNHLRRQPNIDLVELALNHGFSDQAHMTREFKHFAKMTPNQYRELIS